MQATTWHSAVTVVPLQKEALGGIPIHMPGTQKDGSGVKCGINRDELSEIRFHLETVHGKGRMDVWCRFCDIPLSQQRCMKEHEAVCKKGELADKEKRFICQFCDKGFLGKGNFRNHQNVKHWKQLGRKEAKRHHCDKCGLDYVNPSSLKNHLCKPENTVTATATSGNESDGEGEPQRKKRKKNKKSKKEKKA